MKGKKSSFNDILVIGFAVFAMFFGAGNLIFPPLLGQVHGDKYLIVMFGYLLSGVCLPLLGIISAAKAGGHMDDLLSKVHPVFAKIMGLFIVLAIGPLYAIPRTAATTHEMMINPVIPGSSAIIVNLIYFIITYLLVANPSSVVDNVGKILTPGLLIMLAIIIIKGIITPMGQPFNTQNPTSILSTGFNEGYQTMDAIVSIIFASIIINQLVALGIKRGKRQLSLTIKAGAISALLLALIYIGLCYLGASVSNPSANVVHNGDRVMLLQNIVQNLLGSFGKYALGIAVGLACLTTSVGLTASTAEYFGDITNKKYSYKTMVIIICLVSYALSILGVTGLITKLGPFLGIIYPPVMVVILLNLLPNRLQRKGIYVLGVIGAFCVSIPEAMPSFNSAFNLNITLLNPLIELYKKLPLGNMGFTWVFVSVLFILIGLVISIFTKNNLFAEDVSDILEEAI